MPPKNREKFIMNEFMPKTPELSPELQATYEEKQPDIYYALGCGDDRDLTEASRAKLVAENLESLETGAYLRYFGARAGIARVFILAMLAKNQGEALKEMGVSFVDVMNKVAEQVEAKNKVVLVLHSAESNEGSTDHFNPESENGLGCAYAANAGALGHISAEFPPHGDLSRIETADLFGNTHNDDLVAGANAAFVRMYFPDPAVAGLSRKDFDDTGAPVQILRGSHAPVDQTLVAINYSPDKVSNPQTAHEQGTPFYNNDVTQVAEMLMRAFPEYDLDPETLLRIMDSDIRSTRTALAGDAGPAALQVYRIGTPAEAIAHLTNVGEELKRKLS